MGKRVNGLCECIIRQMNKGVLRVRLIGFETKYSVLFGDMWVDVQSIDVIEQTIRKEALGSVSMPLSW